MLSRKRLWALGLSVLLLVSALAGCGEQTPESSTPVPDTSSSTTTTTETEGTDMTTTQPTTSQTGTGSTTDPTTPAKPTNQTSATEKPTGNSTTSTTAKPTTTTTAGKKGYLSKSDTTVEPVRTLSEVKAKLSDADLACDKYDIKKYLTPYWEGNIIYNESLTFCQDKNGRAEAPLLYDAAEILSVKSSDLKTTYKEGVDYILEDGKLVLTANSSIPCFKYSDLYFTQEKAGCSWALKKGGYTLFYEGTYFHQRQVAVTYIHTQPWKGYKPAYQGEMLPQITAKLEKGENVTIVYLGDSIVKGGNASGLFGAAPNMPIWTDMVTAALKAAYPKAKISTYSASENGATTVQAIKNLRQLCSNYKPDLVIIGFGMNDGSDSNITPDRFQANIQSIMETNDLLSRKSCDYLLLSTTLPNQDVKLGTANTQDQHAAKLFELEKQGTATTGGVVVGDMTAIHSYLLKSKRFIDMTANNINHPNDFLVRAYAQLVTTMLIED